MSSEQRAASSAPLSGRARWEVRQVEGSPRGGLYELEQRTDFFVVDRRTGETVASFSGLYESSFTGEGDWDSGSYSGVRAVEIDAAGRFVIAHRADGATERLALPED